MRFLMRAAQALFKALFSTERMKKNKNPAILVVRLDEIGDMVLMSPFLRELRRNYPDAHITLVVKPAVFNLVELCPYVDEILPFARPSGRLFTLKMIWKTFFFAKKHLWEKCLDLAIVPRWDSDAVYGAGWIAFFSRATRRVGYSEHVHPGKELSDYGFDRFYTDVIDNRVLKHEVERDLDVLRFLNIDIRSKKLELWTSNTDEKCAKQLLKPLLHIQNQILIALFLSAGGKRKEWDVQNYVKVLKRVESAYPIHIILLGDKNNTQQYGESFLQKYGSCNVTNLIGCNSLRETIAVLKCCHLYLGGDTGPMHLAAACNLPGVALFLNSMSWRTDGLDTSDRFGPWNAIFRICQPCFPLPGCEHGCTKKFAHCINQISVDSVTEALMNLLENIRLKR